MHIRQINTAKEKTSYTVVDTNNWEGKLSDHPSVIEHPELFEVVDELIPKDAQYLTYESESQ